MFESLELIGKSTSQKEKFSKDEMKSESGHREDGAQDGSSEERTASNGKKRNRRCLRAAPGV